MLIMQQIVPSLSSKDGQDITELEQKMVIKFKIYLIVN